MNADVVTRVFCVICFALGTGALASAHHSNAMYEATKTVTLRGVVTQFRWTNPHVTFTIATDGAKGLPGEVWVLESTSPGNLSRVGWTRTSVATNDRVEVIVAPLRDGSHGGRCRMVTVPEKKESLEC